MAGAAVAVARSAPLAPRLEALPSIHFERVQNDAMSVRRVAAGRVRASFGSRLGLLGAAPHLGLAVTGSRRQHRADLAPPQGGHAGRRRRAGAPLNAALSEVPKPRAPAG